MVPGTSTRRQVIAAGLLSTLPLVSGCSSVSSALTGSEPELGEIAVENADDEPHTIHVAVERGTDLIHGSAHELDPVSEPDTESDFGSVDGAVLEKDAWASKTGDWTIYTRVDEQTSWQHVEISTTDEATCYSVRLKIEDDASVTSFTPDCDSWP